MGTELWRHGAGELAAMIANKEVSSREVVDAHLDRIAEVNPHLEMVMGPDLPMGVQIMADRWQDLTALAVAEDIERAAGRFTPIDPVLA